jgi:hypothetical protein
LEWRDVEEVPSGEGEEQVLLVVPGDGGGYYRLIKR